jgi:hypothetical protein
MKAFIIMCLATALAAAACYTRPGRRELVFFLLDTTAEHEQREWRKGDLEKADKQAKAVTIHDRWLWVEAEKDGQVIYTGAFAHWFPRLEKTEKGERATVTEVARLIGKF